MATVAAFAVPVFYVVYTPELSDLIWNNIGAKGGPDLPRAVLIPIFWLAETFAVCTFAMLFKAWTTWLRLR